MSVKKKRNLLLIVSAGFVGLMVLISIGMYVAGSENKVRIESQSVPDQPTYDIKMDDLSIADPERANLAGLDPEFINDYDLSDVDLDANQQVPEPASMSLLAAGGLGMLARRRKRKSA